MEWLSNVIWQNLSKCPVSSFFMCKAYVMPMLYYDGILQSNVWNSSAEMPMVSHLLDSKLDSCIVLPPAGIRITTVKLYPPRRYYTKLSVGVFINDTSCAPHVMSMASSANENVSEETCISIKPHAQYLNNGTECIFECVCSLQCYALFLYLSSQNLVLCEIEFYM